LSKGGWGRAPGRTMKTRYLKVVNRYEWDQRMSSRIFFGYDPYFLGGKMVALVPPVRFNSLDFEKLLTKPRGR
jgi:hypothetical protein